MKKLIMTSFVVPALLVGCSSSEAESYIDQIPPEILAAAEAPEKPVALPAEPDPKDLSEKVSLQLRVQELEGELVRKRKEEQERKNVKASYENGVVKVSCPSACEVTFDLKEGIK